MTQEDILSDYFKWLTNIVYDDSYAMEASESYKSLLLHLFTYPFAYILPMDESREKDGLRLRSQYLNERHVNANEFIAQTKYRPCSILEMMIALADKCETNIMADQDQGDRTSVWFWNMIISLGLNHMTDDKYDPDMVTDILDRFLSRTYAPNGEGGLFIIHNPSIDMRSTEIWYQMCYYLMEFSDSKMI